MVSFEEFLEQKKKERRGQIKNNIISSKSVRPKGFPRKEFAAKLEEFKKSQELKDLIDTACAEDERMLFLSSEEALKDPGLQAIYKSFLGEQKKKAIRDRASMLLPYILEQHDLLLGLGDKIGERLATQIKEYFVTEEVYQHDNCFNDDDGIWWSKPLTPDNFDEYLEDYAECDIEVCQENFEYNLWNSELAGLIIDHLEAYDTDAFKQKMEEIEAGLDFFDRGIFIDGLQQAMNKAQTSTPLRMLIIDIERTADKRVREGVNVDVLRELIPTNSHYIEAFETARRLKEMLLKEIPSSPIDLYPLARTLNRKFVLHIGPTNSGKTYKALQALKSCKYGVYLAPLRLLAFECYERLNSEGVPCHLITGEEEQYVEGATHSACTIELLDFPSQYDVAVIDEAQMIADKQRGSAWSAAILGVCAKEIHVCAAPEAEQLLVKLIEMCGDTYEIDRCERTTPLVEWHEAFNEGFSFRELLGNRITEHLDEPDTTSIWTSQTLQIKHCLGPLGNVSPRVLPEGKSVVR